MHQPEVDDLGNSMLVTTSTSGTGTFTSQLDWHNVDGSLRWTRMFGAAAVAVSSDRGPYVETDGQLLSLDIDGRERWRQSVAQRPTPGLDVVLATPQAVYVSQGPTLQTFGLDGTPRWTHSFLGETPRAIIPTPTRVFVTANVINGSSRLLALDLQGNELWSIADPGFDGGYVADDASMLFASVRGAIWAIDAAGVVRWTRTVGTSGIGWFALGPSNTLVFTSPYRIEAVNRVSGATVWTASSPFSFASVTSGPSTVFLSNNAIIGYDASTGRLAGKATAGPLSSVRCTSAGLVVRGNGTLQRFDRC